MFETFSHSFPIKFFKTKKIITMKTFKYTVIGLLMQVNLWARTQPVTIGERCPDVEIKNIINYKTTTARISDFRGKLLLLDFWGTFCGPCVASFPRMDALEKEFANDMQVLPVTFEDKEKVQLLFDKLYNVKHVKPFSVIDDTILNTLFPHEVVPHFVWIDKDGIVRKITGDEAVTAENIAAFVKDRNGTGENKQDETAYKLPEFVVGNPLIENKEKVERVDSSAMIYQSILTRGIKGIFGSAHVDTNSITMTNIPILWLYHIAFMKEGLGVGSNRVIIDIKDSSLHNCITPDWPGKETVSGAAYDAWAVNNTYCYNLKVPLALADKKFDIMLEELNNNFGLLKGIEGRIEKRKTKCLVLMRTSEDDKMETNNGEEEVADNRYFLHLQNKSLQWLMWKLGAYYMQLSPLPFLDETSYTGNVDIDINADLSDVNAVNKELEKYGLQFKEAERDINMMVIKEKQ